MNALPRRRVLAALALCVLAAAATPAFFRVIVHFYADFDSAPASSADPNGGEFLAKGGKITVTGPPNVFVLEARGEGGVLAVGPNLFGVPAVLAAKLDVPTKESVVQVDMKLTPDVGLSDLTVVMIDDDAGGMIDLEFDGSDGTVKVGPFVDDFDLFGDPAVAEPYVLATVVLRETLTGPKTWKVTLNAPGVFKKTFSGVLLAPGPLSLASVQIIRPGQTVGGTWEVDDLIVTSPDLSSSSN